MRATTHEPADTVAAALALHEPGMTADEILRSLVDLVRRLDLAEHVSFHPATAAPDGAPRKQDGRAIVPVRRPPAPAGGAERDQPCAGVLRCVPHDPAARAQIEALAAHAAVALSGLARLQEVARREEAMRRVAERLQDSLLPPVPDLPRTLVSVEYRAAGRDTRVGGDFYDVLPLPDGRVLVAVGDVMGKGVEAASRTSRITQTLRALALQGMDLDVLLERVDEQVSFQDPEIMATVWCGLYDPDTGEIAFACLGHPPPLLFREGQEALTLELEGLPLGLRDLSPQPPDVRHRRLAPRDLLVLYTDGVVEASRDVLAGINALQLAVGRRRNEPLHELVSVALDEMLANAGHTDDALMLLLRRR